MKYPEEFINKIIQGNCIKVMQEIPENSIDSIITDPPYGLSFMKKEWDSFKKSKGYEFQIKNLKMKTNQTKLEQNMNFLSWNVAWMNEAKRVLKPGGIILIFSGTRTQHLTGMALELSGFVIADTLMWLYGSGFPKAMEIGKMIDKSKNLDREVVEKKYSSDITKGNYIRGGKKNINRIIEKTKPNSQEAIDWNGYRTIGLKPAYEPIILAYKPREGNYVNNILKYKTGALNIDECRIGGEDKIKPSYRIDKKSTVIPIDKKKKYLKDLGRFPSNVIINEEVANQIDQQSGIKKTIAQKNYGFNKKPLSKTNTFASRGTYIPREDVGGASKFFYCAKATPQEKMNNNHPTVKPIKLMTWLCQLTNSPYENVVLDPFAGSGSTMIACMRTKRNFIGIEKEEDYVKIAKERIQKEKNKKESKRTLIRKK